MNLIRRVSVSLHLAANRFAESNAVSDGEPQIGFKSYFSATGRRAAYSSQERMAKSFTFR